MSVIQQLFLYIILALIVSALAIAAGFILGKKMMLSQKGGRSENTTFFFFADLILRFLKFVPFMLILFILYRVTAVPNIKTTAFIIALALVFEILPLAAFSTFKTMASVSKDILNAAVAMGSDPDEALKYFVFPETRDILTKKAVRLLIYAVLCAVTAGLWIAA